MNEMLTLMKSELVITLIIFLLLFIKIGKGMKNERLLPVLQVLLLLNFIAGFFFNESGHLFGDMFYTNPLIAFEKNILNLGVYLISLLCADWLKVTPCPTQPANEVLKLAVGKAFTTTWCEAILAVLTDLHPIADVTESVTVYVPAAV